MVVVEQRTIPMIFLNLNMVGHPSVALTPLALLELAVVEQPPIRHKINNFAIVNNRAVVATTPRTPMEGMP